MGTAACSKLHMWPAAERGDGPVSIFLWVYLYCLTVLCLLSFVAHYTTDLSCRT